MKKKVIAAALLAAMALTGCGSNEETTTSGETTTQATGFTGEKSAESVNDKGDTTMATVKFENGKPVDVNIDVKLADGTMKSAASADGSYDMKNGEGKKWHEQADLLEDFIVDNKFDLTKVTITNDKGNTDAVSGVSIKVGEYLSLTEKALAKVDADGKEVAETGFTGEKTAEVVSEKGDRTFAVVTFENGNPVAVNIDVETANGMKSELAAKGEYAMKDETQSWDKQADALEAFIVENNFDLSKVTLTNEEGNTDAVSGVTIKVKSYLDVVQQALDAAKAE